MFNPAASKNIYLQQAVNLSRMTSHPQLYRELIGHPIGRSCEAKLNDGRPCCVYPQVGCSSKKKQ